MHLRCLQEVQRIFSTSPLPGRWTLSTHHQGAGVKIRGKLLTLILIPLLAVSSAAVWGFRDQSIKTEQAEEAVELAVMSAAAHDVILAYGDERLALYSDLTQGEIDELRLATDEAVAAAGFSTDVVETARAQTDRIAAADRFTDAIEELLATAGSAVDVYQSGQLLTNIAAQSSYSVLEARETAWFDYIETAQIMAGGDENMSLVPVAVSLSEASTLASESHLFIDQQAEPQLQIASDSVAEQTMANLAFLATNEMASGATGIANAQIIDGLTDARVEWNQALDAADEFLIAETQSTLDDANGVRSLFSLLGVVGMVVLAGLVFVIYRSITSPLENLVVRARAVAQDELPDLVRTLRSDDEFDNLPEPVAIPVTNNDEIGQLVEAFNEVQFTAHELATEQALGRRNVAEMFVNLGRRNQQLLQRILGLLTDLERDEEDPDTLRDLFVLDNVVTRMRRNAESLLVLAGGQTPRQWSNPVSLEDTVRSALSEVEGYERIDIAALAEVRIPGNVVADVAHLLAELIENAVSFSDPSTQVLVGGHFENDGYLVTIFDQGIGMTEDELEDNNRRIVDPPPLDQAPTKFLGLFVVGRLADRHDIRVRLAKAPGRGVMARVLIPNANLIIDEDVDTTPTVGVEDLDSAVMSAAEAGLVNAGMSAPEVETSEAVDFYEADLDVVGHEAAPLGDDVGGLDHALSDVGTDEAPVAEEPISQPVVASDALDALPVRGAAPAVEEPPAAIDDLPVRSAGASIPEPEAAEDALPTRRVEDNGGLPTRVRGDALDEDEAPAPAAPPERVEAVGEEAAGSFSSMMSAFSTGVNRGLEDTSFDSLDEGTEQ